MHPLFRLDSGWSPDSGEHWLILGPDEVLGHRESQPPYSSVTFLAMGSSEVTHQILEEQGLRNGHQHSEPHARITQKSRTPLTVR